MRIAIALFGTRVSPRFDYAPSLLVIDIEDGAAVRRREIATDLLPPAERIKRLAELAVETLICGGIDDASAGRLEEQGIALVPWVSGEADDALEGCLHGELVPGAMIGKGGHCCGRWRFRHRGGCDGRP